MNNLEKYFPVLATALARQQYACGCFRDWIHSVKDARYNHFITTACGMTVLVLRYLLNWTNIQTNIHVLLPEKYYSICPESIKLFLDHVRVPMPIRRTPEFQAKHILDMLHIYKFINISIADLPLTDNHMFALLYTNHTYYYIDSYIYQREAQIKKIRYSKLLRLLTECCEYMDHPSADLWSRLFHVSPHPRPVNDIYMEMSFSRQFHLDMSVIKSNIQNLLTSTVVVKSKKFDRISKRAFRIQLNRLKYPESTVHCFDTRSSNACTAT